jgi:hypothetical protein
MLLQMSADEFRIRLAKPYLAGEETVKRKKLPLEALEFFKQAGRRGGKIGGKRSLETMTPEERTERAKKAAAKSAEVRKKKAAKKRKA